MPRTPTLYIPGVGTRGEGLTIPGAALATFDAFRVWKLSRDCPRWGKFEWIGGRVRLEVEPELIVSHNGPRNAVARTLGNLVSEEDRGLCFSSRTPVASPDDAHPVLCEPDFVFLSHEAILEGRVMLTPKVGRDGDFTEIVGPPDVVVEVRSDSSTRKNTVDLPADLFALGVTEYWLADARVDPPALAIHVRGGDPFEPVAAGEDGFVASIVVGRSFRLETSIGRSGLRQTRLRERA